MYQPKNKGDLWPRDCGGSVEALSKPCLYWKRKVRNLKDVGRPLGRLSGRAGPFLVPKPGGPKAMVHILQNSFQRMWQRTEAALVVYFTSFLNEKQQVCIVLWKRQETLKNKLKMMHLEFHTFLCIFLFTFINWNYYIILKYVAIHHLIQWIGFDF